MNLLFYLFIKWITYEWNPFSSGTNLTWYKSNQLPNLFIALNFFKNCSGPRKQSFKTSNFFKTFRADRVFSLFLKSYIFSVQKYTQIAHGSQIPLEQNHGHTWWCAVCLYTLRGIFFIIPVTSGIISLYFLFFMF